MKEFGRWGQVKQAAVANLGSAPPDGLPHPIVGIFLLPLIAGIGFGSSWLGDYVLEHERTFFVALFIATSIMYGLCCGMALRGALNPPGERHWSYRLIYALEAALCLMLLRGFLISTYAIIPTVRGGAMVEFGSICIMSIGLILLLLFKEMKPER